MKYNNLKIMSKNIIVVLFLLGTSQLFAQNINFTFSNAQNTNDGVNDHYEVDVFIESNADFKLGSGLLYFNYNTAAFGSNISGGSKVEITYPDAQGYICGQKDNVSGIVAIYGPFIKNDNIDSRFSFAFLQTFSSGSFANNVTATPTKLFHIKIEYLDVNEDPMLAFEGGAAFDDQFTTACGPSTLPFTAADCSGFPGIQLVNDTFSSFGGILGIDDEFLAKSITFYPNPVANLLTIDSEIPLKKVEIYSVLGRKVKEVKSDFESIPTNNLSNGIYVVRMFSENGLTTKKLIKK